VQCSREHFGLLIREAQLGERFGEQIWPHRGQKSGCELLLFEDGEVRVKSSTGKEGCEVFASGIALRLSCSHAILSVHTPRASRGAILGPPGRRRASACLADEPSRSQLHPGHR
jgi:hypothetical protein